MGFGDAVTRIPKINSPWGSGLKSAILKRPRSGAGRGPPRQRRPAKWTEILGAPQTTKPIPQQVGGGGLPPGRQSRAITSSSNTRQSEFQPWRDLKETHPEDPTQTQTSQYSILSRAGDLKTRDNMSCANTHGEDWTAKVASSNTGSTAWAGKRKQEFALPCALHHLESLYDSNISSTRHSKMHERLPQKTKPSFLPEHTGGTD